MKKTLRNIFVFTLAIIICLPYNFSVKAAAIAIPKLQIVTQPKAEYKPGERITFTVTSPNYTGKVQYRVILYNGTTKITSELWNTPKTGYYYTGWQPSGNYKFNITWIVKNMDPGAYSMTVLVRRVGAKVSYDSYVDTKSFLIRDAANNGGGDNTNNPGNTTGSIFTPNGTEKRVSIIDAKDTYAYDKILNSKLYYAKPKYFDETTPNNTINDNIKYLTNQDTLYYICTSDKNYAMFIGGTSIVRNYNLALDQLKGVYNGRSVFDGKPHNFEVYLYEVYFDNNTGKYYLANENHTEILGGIAKEITHTKGEVPKYVAIPVMIADF